MWRWLDDGSKIIALMAVVPCGAEELISGWTMSSNVDEDGGSATMTMWRWLEDAAPFSGAD